MSEEDHKGARVFSDVFYPNHATVCTNAFSRFLREYHANLDFLFFVVQLVSSADKNRVAAAEALIPGERDPVRRRDYEGTLRNPEATLNELKRHSTVLSRNLTNGIVNAFQRYFSSIINSAALKKPELLSSSQTIKIDEVLRFSKHKDLIAFIVDKKINELAYGGLLDMEKYFNDRMGVKMFEGARQRDLLRFFVEVRNINVHNGGIVNEVFASRVGAVDGFPYTKGRNLHVDMDALITLSDNAMRVAMHIDASVSTKFGLQRKAHRTWKEGRKKQTVDARPEPENAGAEAGSLPEQP